MCVLGAQKNRLIEKVLLKTHNIVMFWSRNKKNSFPLLTLILRLEVIILKIVHENSSAL